jgi:hypothetical protein
MARFAYEPLGCFSHLHHIIRTTVVQGAPNRERIVGAPGNWPETAFEETSIRPGRAVEKPNTAVRSPRRGLRGRFGPWTAAD